MSPPPPLRQSGLFLVQAPHRDKRADAREQEEDGKSPFPHIPVKESAEIVEDVNRKGESEAVEMRSALECAENRDDGHCALDDDGGDEHRVYLIALRPASAW